MSIRKKYRAEPHLDMGPFSDVAFLLIIFFIVTTTLVRPMGRLIDIPSAASDKKEEERKNLTVTLMVDKMLFGRDEASQKQTSLPAFRAELAGMNLASKAEQDRMIVVGAEDSGVRRGEDGRRSLVERQQPHRRCVAPLLQEVTL